MLTIVLIDSSNADKNADNIADTSALHQESLLFAVEVPLKYHVAAPTAGPLIPGAAGPQPQVGPTVGLCLGPYGSPRRVGSFL